MSFSVRNTLHAVSIVKYFLDTNMGFFHTVSFQTKKPEYLLDVATRMYVRDGVYLRPRFSKILGSFYNGSIQNIDFHQSRKAVHAVNSWVSEVTHGKIKSMFSEGRQTYT